MAGRIVEPVGEFPKGKSYAASRAHRWFRCPGSVPHVARMPVEPEGPSARLGKAVHRVCEERLRGDVPTAEDVREVAKGGMTEVAEFYVWYVAGLAKRVDGRLEVEKELSLSYSGGKSHIDAVIHAGRDLYVIDLKTGTRVREKPDSEQMMIYATEYVLLQNVCENVETIIVQPRMSPKVSVYHVTAKELLYWRRNTLMPAYERARTATLDDKVPGEEQCQWCSARSECDAYEEWMRSDRSMWLDV